MMRGRPAPGAWQELDVEHASHANAGATIATTVPPPHYAMAQQEDDAKMGIVTATPIA